MTSVLVSYSCVMTYHKFSSLKRNIYYFTVSIGQRSGYCSAGSSAQGPEGLEPKRWKKERIESELHFGFSFVQSYPG